MSVFTPPEEALLHLEGLAEMNFPAVERVEEFIKSFSDVLDALARLGELHPIPSVMYVSSRTLKLIKEAAQVGVKPLSWHNRYNRRKRWKKLRR